MIYQKFKNAFHYLEEVLPIMKDFEEIGLSHVGYRQWVVHKQLLMVYVKEKEKLSVLEDSRQSIKEGLL